MLNIHPGRQAWKSLAKAPEIPGGLLASGFEF